MFIAILTFCCLGACAGVLAGLLGLGGGAVIVPMLMLTFPILGLDSHPDLIKVAVGTSLGSIMFTAISSSLSHHRKGAVDWRVFKFIAGGILVGTFLGSFVASLIPGKILQAIFVCFLYYVAVNMILNKKPNPSRTLPGLRGLSAAGLLIGGFSSLVGIGGGTLTVPYLVWHNVDMRRAIGTSAAVGFPIAFAGFLGYVTNGWNAEWLPEYCLGYVYLPALAGIVLFSAMTAPIGASIAHKVPVPKLKKFFAVFLFVIATKMLVDLI